MFIPPMLATSLRDRSRFADPRYVAEPKLDGQRAQIHVADHRAVAAFSRPGRSLLGAPGVAWWLRAVEWPVAQCVLDGELCADTGQEASSGSSRPGSRGRPRWPSWRLTCCAWTATT
jgi:ATP-dependent DNA ligase